MRALAAKSAAAAIAFSALSPSMQAGPVETPAPRSMPGLEGMRERAWELCTPSLEPLIRNDSELDRV
jgi:hypothetical protein